MADGGQSKMGRIFKGFKEAIGKPAVSEAKTDLKTTAQFIGGSIPTPQQQQQKQQEEQQTLTDARHKIDFFKQIDWKLSQIRNLRAQQEDQYKKDIGEKMKVKQFVTVAGAPVPSKPKNRNEAIARQRQEIGKGRGIGG